jgi:hypothetical protein
MREMKLSHIWVEMVNFLRAIPCNFAAWIREDAAPRLSRPPWNFRDDGRV